MTHPLVAPRSPGALSFVSRPERLDPAAPGEHRWIILLTHVVSAEIARELVMLDEPTFDLDDDSIVTATLGCFVCEQPASEAVIGQPCPGEPS